MPRHSEHAELLGSPTCVVSIVSLLVFAVIVNHHFCSTPSQARLPLGKAFSALPYVSDKAVVNENLKTASLIELATKQKPAASFGLAQPTKMATERSADLLHTASPTNFSLVQYRKVLMSCIIATILPA